MTEQFLVPLDEYLKVGLHIGTKVKTSHMRNFIYKIRPDGLPVLNVEEIDKRLSIASDIIKKYSPEEILVVCRRENGWKAAKLFSKLTGIKAFAGRYPPGVLTNPELRAFVEAKLIIVTDPWPDKNAIKDAAALGIPVIAFCDTNNEAHGIDFVVPCNNKGKRSLALVFWILAREYLKHLGKVTSDDDFKYTLEDFTPE